MRLVVSDIEAKYVVTRPFRAPFHSGGMFHGLLGWALRRCGCEELPACAGSCARPGRCTWSRLFDPPRPQLPPHRLLTHIGEPPGPIALIVPRPGACELAIGQDVSFGIRLFGCVHNSDVESLERALESIPTLPIGREKGCVRLERLIRQGPAEHDIAPAGNRDMHLTVHFETPVRIKREGRPAEDIDFGTLFLQLWRRLTMLSALYGHYGTDDDDAFQMLRTIAPLVQTADRRLCPLRWDHFSSMTSERKPMRGLIGHVSFEGNVGPFLPMLAAGEVVHVGGGTSFGLGRMRVEVTGKAATGT